MLSQEDLATRIPMSADAFGKLERGQTTPKLATVAKIAQALEVQPFELLSEPESVPPTQPNLAAASQVQELLNRIPNEDRNKIIVMLKTLIDAYESGRNKP